ncbi:MAG: hypothetical protein GY943_28435 [Chloroflexi bacterium]|nr:hypothetical protein [Chloroflexota bacterium]
MPDLAQQLLQTQLPDDRLAIFAQRLTDWLIADLNQSEDDVPAFTESRAKALLRAANVIDDPTLHDFMKLVESDTAVRIALHDLLLESGLAENDEIQATAATSAAAPEGETTIHWLSLSIAAHAWKTGYPLHQLDPASPPGEYSPAGQLVKRAAYFMRQQIQRSATERDKLTRKLAYTADSAPGTPSLAELPAEQPVAPVPPHYRPPIPVNYPEVANETLSVEPETRVETETAVSRNAPITITNADLEPDTPQPIRMPAIKISKDQVNQAARQQPSRQVRQPAPRNSSSEFSQAVRRQWGRNREPMRTTKMRVIVQEYPDGPSMYGLQVRVTCKGVKSYVAGTTNRDGLFFCELPVRVQSGLTYDVDITWPRDLGGNTERKSITLNADRTQFDLPFYMRHNA